MRTTRICMMLGCGVLIFAASARGQMKQKPGLWEMTTTMSMAGMPDMPAAPQLPPGVQLPPMASPFAPHTVQVCVTQAMIDKYGGPYSNPPRGDCKITDLATKPNGMTAKIVCTGQMNATGTVEAWWTDADSTKTTMHMTGTMNSGEKSTPVDMTMKSTSVYKGPDCGNVKPLAIPPAQ